MEIKEFGLSTMERNPHQSVNRRQSSVNSDRLLMIPGILGLRIDQIFRYNMCIDTKCSVFDISFDT